MSNQIRKIYFKLIYSHGIQIEIDPNLRMCDLNEYIKPKILDEYNIENYVIVEAGLSLGENHCPIDETEQITFKNKYNMNIDVAFYIRPLISSDPSHSNESTLCSDESSCPICFENAEQPINLVCGHIFCHSCISSWVTFGRNSCPMCRGQIA